MDWPSEAAEWLREWLTKQAWLDGWQSSIAQTPDWALLGAGPATLLLFALMLRISWPQLRKSNTDRRTTSPPAQLQSRQRASEPPRVAQAPATKSPLAPTPARQPAASRAPLPMPDEEEDNRSVRVFVSSTFLDMQAERDELVTKVFPALRAKYRARGVEVFEVDLRWGITKEQQERGETLLTLLAEIDRCRPYFIGLLGDRYGWVPPAAALTEKLKADYPALADAQGASVTAMEIMHGVLANPDTAARAIFLERDATWDWRATLNGADCADATAEPEESQSKLADLKAMIRKLARIETYARPGEIGEKVTAALDALLEARFPETDAPDAVEQTARLHRAYARERRVLHVGARGYVDDLNRWMETNDAAPILITGASGGGKSTLLANWLHTWRKAHPKDITFEYYLGAAPYGTNPTLIMITLWEHLNRVTGESDALPDVRSTLMDVSAALAQRLALARFNAERSSARLLIALDGLDKLSSEQNLSWLPVVPGVHLLASSLDSEAKSTALARGFTPLEVKPLTELEGQAFIAGMLARWQRELEPQNIASILKPVAAELAGSPLYLKTVLEELRVSADNARLAERLEDYRAARDMPDLFDRVLKRLEDDCDPGLVAKALPLIWASRAGLEETEILAITDTSPLAWATLRNSLGDALRDQQGRIAFGHDYLNQAVARRYVQTDEQKRATHLSIADCFDAREADERQAEELPHQFRAAEAWVRLEALLVDLNRFEFLRAGSDRELFSYWLPLMERGRDPEALLCAAFKAHAGADENWSEPDINLAVSITRFLDFAGAYGEARTALQKSLPVACERLFGPGHPMVATTLNLLALLLTNANRFDEAEPLYRRAITIDESNFGSDDPALASKLNNLADLLAGTNRQSEAEPLYRRALAIDESSLGRDHAEVARILHNLAKLLRDSNRYDEAESASRRALTIIEARLGPEHPDAATALTSLGRILIGTARHPEAEQHYRRALHILEVNFGPEHPALIGCLNLLAAWLRDADRQLEAEMLLRRAALIAEQTYGPNHSSVAAALSGLIHVMFDSERYDEAEPLLRRALAIEGAVFGPEHSRTLNLTGDLAYLLYATKRYDEAEALYRRLLESETEQTDVRNISTRLNNLALLLEDTGRHSEAEILYGRALAISKVSFGLDHPRTLQVRENLQRLRGSKK